MTNEELCKRYQNGDAQALEDLYIQNKGLIESIIKKYSALADPDDLRQESFFAIRQAAALWELSKGANFATYCAYWIKQRAIRYIYDYSGTIRAPVHTRERIRRYNNTVNAYRVKFGRDPSQNELCFALDLSRQQLDDLRRDIMTIHPRSTSEPIGEEGEDTLQDFLRDDRDPIGDVLERIHREEVHRAIESELERLPEKEASIIRKRYFKGMTLKEIGTDSGITPERVRQMEENALRKLRRPAATKRLLAYYTEGGAYSAGLRRTGLNSFRNDHTSAQERAIIRLEEIAGRIWENWPQTPQNTYYVAK